MSCPRSSFNNFSDSGLFVLSGAKDLYVPNYQTVGAIFARWLSIKMTATATFLETFFCKELLGHDTSSPLKNYLSTHINGKDAWSAGQINQGKEIEQETLIRG